MNKLAKGKAVIPFQTTDLEGKAVNLADYQGQKVLLTFFRKASCPFCNMGIQQLIKHHQQFEEKGIKIIALFASPKEQVEKYAGQQQAPFPIIPDGEFEIYRQYGVEVSYAKMLKSMVNPVKVGKAMFGGFFSLRSMTQEPVIPADFLIDEQQNIHRAYYGQDYDDHLPIAEVLNWN